MSVTDPSNRLIGSSIFRWRCGRPARDRYELLQPLLVSPMQPVPAFGHPRIHGMDIHIWICSFHGSGCWFHFTTDFIYCIVSLTLLETFKFRLKFVNWLLTVICARLPKIKDFPNVLHAFGCMHACHRQ